MLLEELNLIGFGKFNNERIILKEGMNLIYGENEAGKSTIHSFIDGMFYGFLKPDVKRKDYLPEYEKYNPWDKSKYAGIIRLKYNGKGYRIERIFTKGEEQTKIIDEDTGADITRNIDVGNSRVLQPGIHFFGVNTRVFSNTIFIKQLGTKTDEKLANEVTEKLVNMSTALDDSISVDKAMDELRGKMIEIGTEKASTKPYARNIKDIESLEKEKKEILMERESYESYLSEKARIRNDLVLASEKLAELNETVKGLELLEKAKVLEEAKILSGEIENLKNKIRILLPYANLSRIQYEEVIKLMNSIEYIENSLKDHHLELENMKRRMDIMKDSIYGNDEKENYEEVRVDYEQYESAEENRNRILYNKEESKIEFLKRDYKSAKEKAGLYRIIGVGSAIGVTGFLATRLIIYSIPFFMVAFISFMGYIKKKKEIKDILVEIHGVEKAEKERENHIQIIEDHQRLLLEKYNVDNKIELKRLLDRLELRIHRKNEEMEVYNGLEYKMSSLMEKISKEELNKEENHNRLMVIFQNNNVKDIEEFNLGLDKKQDYNKYITELEGKTDLLRMTLGENTIEDLASEVNQSYGILRKVKLDTDKNQLKYEIERVKEKISDNRIALKGIEENLNILGRSMDRLVIIEEELDRKKAYKIELENKYNSLEMAVNIIEKLSKDIHARFSPALNKTVGKIVEKITGGKYNTVKISEDLNIGVENPITREIVDIHSLSGGTMDQLYFSLRLGISDNNLPLILDDCFIQYDNYRLEKILEFLMDIGKERQVILFTCHHREKEILDKFGIEYNLINLT